MPVEYYTNLLYPLQDRAVQAFNRTPFYLTGGTTLSRGYYNHRYSDDLDYFVNDHPEFKRISDLQIDTLRKLFNEVKVIIADKSFYRILVGLEKLKIELVNDVPSHIGKITEHPILGNIDSKENILANKITAVIDRKMPKDIADIYFLLKDGLDIKKALLDAESKAAGIPPLYVAKTFGEFDYSLLDTEIKWITPVSSQTIKSFLTSLSLDIVKGNI